MLNVLLRNELPKFGSQPNCGANGSLIGLAKAAMKIQKTG